MTYKTIFSGRLEFGSARTFEQVLKMFQHRVENFYKSDILLKQEDIFDEAEQTLTIARLIVQAAEKSWRNTINLLDYLAQYAVAGSLNAWLVEDGKVLKQRLIEPKGDKVAVQSFLEGRQLVAESGRETEAKEALSKAIEKFARHALAYERRGHVNYLLHNFDDAIYDFTKSIDINSNNADPYLGRALVYLSLGKLDEAIADLEQATRNSIPLQPVYWQARRIKGESHLKLEEYQKAALELKLFTRRAFAPDNPNYSRRRKAFLDYGKALLGLGEYADAVKIFNQALQVEGDLDDQLEAEQLLLRGIALQKSGQTGYQKDWEEAASRGSRRAAELLAEMA